MTLSLRPYQEQAIEGVRGHLRAGRRRVLLQLPTGGGKTVIAASMIGAAARKGASCIFICHRRELVKQTSRTFFDVGIGHGIIAAGFAGSPGSPVQIAAVQTLARRLHRVRQPRVVMWDEAHHVAAKSWADIFARYPDAVHVGLSATPERLDGRGLGDWFQAMVKGPSVRALIEGGSLSPYRLFAPTAPDLAGVRTVAGDFSRAQLGASMDRSKITGDAIQHYRKHASGKRAVVFCVSIQHSQHVVAQFQAAGYSALHIDGEMSVEDRDAAIRAFEAGKVQVLSSVDLVGEGFDCPAVEVAILLRPTQSLSLYLQQIGRALRPFRGKAEALILDHAGNALRHGLPDDDRDWSLEGRAAKKKSDGAAASVRQCPDCFAVLPIHAKRCACGHVFAVAAREIEQVDGELVEVDAVELRRRMREEVARANSYEDLVRIEVARGYKAGWADAEMERRTGRNRRDLSLDELVARGMARGYANAEGWARHLYTAFRQRRAG